MIHFKIPKKSFIFYTVTCLSVIAFFSLTFVAYGKLSEQAENNLNKKTIVLDAGHGGEDGGAIGFNDIIEKDINLSISLKLRTLLKSYGYNVIMTREKDESIYDKSSKTLREKKRSDLNNRIKIIKNNEGKNAIFVSIHQNKFPNKKYFGTQIFYSDNNEKSQNLATSIRKSVVGLIQPNNSREIKPSNKKIFLLENSTIPSVIVECGFLSNEEEARKLATDEYQNKVAFSIYCGIMNYFLNNT